MRRQPPECGLRPVDLLETPCHDQQQRALAEAPRQVGEHVHRRGIGELKIVQEQNADGISREQGVQHPHQSLVQPLLGGRALAGRRRCLAQLGQQPRRLAPPVRGQPLERRLAGGCQSGPQGCCDRAIGQA